MKDNTIWLIGGGAAIVAYFVWKNNSSLATPVTATTTATSPVTGPPNPPDLSGNTINNYNPPADYYATVLYPAMLAADPNLGNSAYTPTIAQANMLLENYLDLRQGLVQNTNSHTTLAQAAQNWWHTNGVSEMRTWFPLNPTSSVPYTGPVKNPNSSGSGNTLSTVATVAKTALPIAAMLLGVGEVDDSFSGKPLLNDAEAELIITGAAIAFDILPFYYSQKNNLALSIEDNLEGLVDQYTR